MAAWCGRTAVIGLLAPAAALAVLRWRASGRLGGALRFAVLARAVPLVPSRDGAAAGRALRAARDRDRRGATASRSARAASRRARSAARSRDRRPASARAPRSARSWCRPGSRCATSTPPRAASRASRSSWCRRSPSSGRRRHGAAESRSRYVLVPGRGRVRRPGAPAPAARALPGRGTLAQWVGLAILAPIGLLNPIIFDRYLIGTLPLVLLGVAAVSPR